MGPVFELFPLESGETVEVGEVLPVAPAGRVEELEGPTGAPAGISGVAENTGLQLSTKSGVDNPYHQWTSICWGSNYSQASVCRQFVSNIQWIVTNRDVEESPLR